MGLQQSPGKQNAFGVLESAGIYFGQDGGNPVQYTENLEVLKFFMLVTYFRTLVNIVIQDVTMCYTRTVAVLYLVQYYMFELVPQRF